MRPNNFVYGHTQNLEIAGPEVDLYAVSPEEKALIVKVAGIADTGATMTCVPQSIIDTLGGINKLVSSNTDVETGDGHVEEHDTYYINVRIADCEFSELEVIAFDKEYAIIGRDILNQYSLIFEAKRNRWRVFQR